VPYIEVVHPREADPCAPPSIDDPDLGPKELVILLRSRATPAAVVARIGQSRSWMRARDVKFAFVSNPRAPQVLARRFLPHLGWRDLAELSVNLGVSPVLRREAEKLLKTRLPELSLGEKVALARRGSRGLVELLLEETDALVLRAVAGNSRATEADFSRMLSRPEVPVEFLGWLATLSSWGQRRSVRLALVRHPRTPPSAALRLTQDLSRADLDALRRDPLAPRLVRVAAERRLEPEGADFRKPRTRFG
jgi:hypothetical protein